MDVTPSNILSLVETATVVLDATDNFETRYLVNDACVKLGLPWIYGGVVETSGMSLTILPGDTPCLRCLFPEPPPPGSFPTCDTVGILNALPAIIAARQVAEALKVILDREAVNRQLVQLDVWENRFRQLRVAREPDCPTCAAHQFTFLETTQTAWVTTLCGRDAVQITPPAEQPVNLAQLAESLRPAGQVTDNGLLLQFTPDDDHQLLIFPDGRVVVKGTTDEAVARTLYARYLGS
jgi:adenylyltransferase/sulfurtransferase